MVRKVILLVFFCLATLNGFSQKRDTSNEHRRNLFEIEIYKSNHVKIMTKIKVKNQNDPIESGQIVAISYFDKSGFQKKILSYEEYEDSTSTEFEYYSDGYLKTEKVTTGASQSVITTYTYDSTGKYKGIDYKSAEYREFDFKYDKNGNLIKKMGYAYFPKVDEKGNVSSTEKVRTLIDNYEFKYDKYNRLTEKSYKNKSQNIYKTKNSYDKRGNKIEIFTTYLGNKVKNKFIYDEKNLITEEVKINIDGSKSYYKYSYELYK